MPRKKKPQKGAGGAGGDKRSTEIRAQIVATLDRLQAKLEADPVSWLQDVHAFATSLALSEKSPGLSAEVMAMATERLRGGNGHARSPVALEEALEMVRSILEPLRAITTPEQFQKLSRDALTLFIKQIRPDWGNPPWESD